MKILFIAPYEGLAELVRSMNLELQGFEITTYVANLEKSKDFWNQYDYLERDFDAIISRGGTAEILRQYTSMQVIEIDVSGYDILRLITYLKNIKSKVGVVGFNNVISNFKSISSLIDIDLKFKTIKSEKDVEHVLTDLSRSGIDIIVGDTVTVEVANSLNMNGVLLTSGKEAILEAFNRAKILKAETLKLQNRIGIFNDLLNRLEYPIALVDEEYKLNFANIKYTDLFGDRSNNIIELYKNITIIDSEILHEGQTTLNLKDSFFESPYVIKIDRINDKYMNVFNSFEFNKDLELESEIKISLWDFNDEEKNMLDSHVENERDNNFEDDIAAITLIGEFGTGHEVIASNIASETTNNKRIMEVEFNYPSTKLFNRLCNVMQNLDNHYFWVFSHMHKLTKTQQQNLTKLIKEEELQVIFKIVDNKVLADKNVENLVYDLKNLIQQKVIYTIALNQRKEKIEMFILDSIKIFNEKYGKQIVGVKNNDFSFYRNQRWAANFIELKLKVEKLYLETQDDFLPDRFKNEFLNLKDFYNKSTVIPIDSTQTLKKIEEDIINSVYVQENKNQSSTARRLDIDRTTLWRRLNK